VVYSGGRKKQLGPLHLLEQQRETIEIKRIFPQTPLSSVWPGRVLVVGSGGNEGAQHYSWRTRTPQKGVWGVLKMSRGREEDKYSWQVWGAGKVALSRKKVEGGEVKWAW